MCAFRPARRTWQTASYISIWPAACKSVFCIFRAAVCCLNTLLPVNRTTGGLPDQFSCRANYVLGQVRSRQSHGSKVWCLAKAYAYTLDCWRNSILHAELCAGLAGSRTCRGHVESNRTSHQRHCISCSESQVSTCSANSSLLCTLFLTQAQKMRAIVLTEPDHKLTLSICCRYGVLVYNGSVHYWQISRVLQREGLRRHLLPSEQTVVDAVRKLPDKQEWLSTLLLQLALGQLEVLGKAA